jgi:hypothetical protein
MSDEEIQSAIDKEYPRSGEDVAFEIDQVKNAALEGQDLANPFDQMSNDDYVLYRKHLANKKTSFGDALGIAKDTFTNIIDEAGTGIGATAYKLAQGDVGNVAESAGKGMVAGTVGLADIAGKILNPAKPIPSKEEFIGKPTTRLVEKPQQQNVTGLTYAWPSEEADVTNEDDYNKLIESEKQRDASIVNNLYAMELTLRGAPIEEVARGFQYVDPTLIAGAGGALAKTALTKGASLFTKAGATAAAKTAVITPLTTATRPFVSTAPNAITQAGLGAIEGTAGAVQGVASLPSKALQGVGQIAESVAPGSGVGAQATALTASAMGDLGLTAGVVGGAKATEKVAEVVGAAARIAKEEASRAGNLERIALDPTVSPAGRKLAAGLAQFQPLGRAALDVTKGAAKGAAAGSVVGGALGGLAEQNLEGVAAGFGAGAALGGLTGSLHGAFEFGKEAIGKSTARTQQQAAGDINNFVATRPEVEQAAWSNTIGKLASQIGPERAASQLDAMRVAEASGAKVRIATLDEAKQWQAPGWVNIDGMEIVLNPEKIRGDTAAHESAHILFNSVINRAFRPEIETAIFGLADPVSGQIVKPGVLDDVALARVAEQIRDGYGKNTIAANEFQGFANTLKNSTDADSLANARSRIADEIAATYTGRLFDRVRAGRFNPDRLPLVYRKVLSAIEDGVLDKFRSVMFEKGMDLGFDNVAKTFRNEKGKAIRIPELDAIVKKAYSQKLKVKDAENAKPDLIPVNPADRALWAKTYGGAKGVLNDNGTPKSQAQIDAEAAARWQDMTSRLSALPDSEKIGIDFARDKTGKTVMTAKGQLSPTAINAILDSGALDPSAKAVLVEVLNSMQRADKSTFDTRYYGVYTRGKGGNKMVAGVKSASQNEILPYSVEINSKDGVLIRAVDVSKVRDRLATALNKPEFKSAYDSPAEALKGFRKYLDNITQINAIDSATLLGGGVKGATRRNLFYDALGFRLRNGETLLNAPQSVINKSQNTIKSYRAERFAKLVDSGNKFAFEEATTYERALRNFQPDSFTPESLPNGEAYTNPDGFRILNKTGSKLFRTYDDTGKLIGVAESKEKAVKKAMDEATKRVEKEEPSTKRFQFAGEAAEMPQFMRDSLETAKAMAKEGKDSETIRAITGWFPGKYDDKMRWEVPDEIAHPKGAEPAGKLVIKRRDVATRLRNPEAQVAELQDIMGHPQLYKAYPEAKTIRVNLLDKSSRFRGAMSNDLLDPDGPILSVREDLQGKELVSTILHEVQHWIQDKEGFAKGGSPEQAMKLQEKELNLRNSVFNSEPVKKWIKQQSDIVDQYDGAELESQLNKHQDKAPLELKRIWNKTMPNAWETASPTELYRVFAGEIESRDIQARQSFTPEQRKAIAPYSSENIAKDEAIVLKNADKAESSKRFQPVDQVTTAVPDFKKTPAGDKPLLEVIYFKNQDKFKEAVAKGRVQKGVPIETFENMSLAIHQPDSAMVGDVVMQGDKVVTGQGGVYYPVLFGDKGSFWASTEKAAKSMAEELNKISRLNNGKILMGLTSAPIDKMFSSTTMSNGMMQLLYKIAQSPRPYGINKSTANKILVDAVNTPLVKNDKKTGKTTVFKFDQRLRSSSSMEDNMSIMNELLAPDKSAFPLRKHFVQNIAKSIASHLSQNKRASQEFASLISPLSNKYAKGDIVKGKLSTSGIIQALGDLFSEEFTKDFQSITNPGGVGGYLYAILEMDGEVVPVQNKQHVSYDYSVDSTSGQQPKVHILDKPVKWNDTLGLVNTQDYVPESIKDNVYPTNVGFSFFGKHGNLMVMKPKEGALTPIEITRFQPDPASPNILNGSDGSRIIKSTSGKYRVYFATGALAGVKDSLESAQKLIQTKSK